MGDRLELERAKKAMREALPDGAGDFTVTLVAHACQKFAIDFHNRQLAGPCETGFAPAPQQEVAQDG